MDGNIKITYTNFQIFLKISPTSVNVEIVDFALNAVIDSFESYTTNFSIEKKFWD